MSLPDAPTRKSVPSAALASKAVTAATSTQAHAERLVVMLRFLLVSVPREAVEYSTAIS